MNKKIFETILETIEAEASGAGETNFFITVHTNSGKAYIIENECMTTREAEFLEATTNGGRMVFIPYSNIEHVTA